MTFRILVGIELVAWRSKAQSSSFINTFELGICELSHKMGEGSSEPKVGS